MMILYEVTNFQYELFDPEHKKIRGQKRGSKNEVFKKSIPFRYCAFDSVIYTEIRRWEDMGFGK